MIVTCPRITKLSTINHEFFTRNGGVSEGIYASLNCGYGSSDDFAKVSENRRRVAEKMGGGKALHRSPDSQRRGGYCRKSVGT